MKLYVVRNCHLHHETHNKNGCPFSGTKDPRFDGQSVFCGHPRFGEFGRAFDNPESDERGSVLPPPWCPMKEDGEPHLVFIEGQVTLAQQGMAAHMSDLREGLRWLAERVHQAYHKGPIEACSKATCDHAMKLLGAKSG